MDCRPNNDYSPAFGDGSYQYARRPKALQQILQEIQECADKPLTQSTTLPPEAYERGVLSVGNREYLS